jgi:hypothetical protein
MRKFISKHWIFLVSLIVAIAITFFYVPFILTNPPSNGMTVNPCPPEFERLCNLSKPVTLYNYLQDREPITSIGWHIPAITTIFIFAILYGEIKSISYIIKKKDKKKSSYSFIWKILAVAAIVYVPFFIVSLILTYFGLSMTQ